jgi:hypothetical protein
MYRYMRIIERTNWGGKGKGNWEKGNDFKDIFLISLGYCFTYTILFVLKTDYFILTMKKSHLTGPQPKSLSINYPSSKSQKSHPPVG